MYTIELYNGHQQKFYRQLTNQRRPECPENLFANFDFAIDFLQAFIKARQEELEQGQNKLEVVLKKIREQALTIEPERLEDFLFRCYSRFTKEGIDLNIVTLPFSCAPRDEAQALKVWELILKPIFSEDMFVEQKGFDPAIELVALLISRQAAVDTWPLLLESVKRGMLQAHHLFRRFLMIFAIMNRSIRFISAESKQAPAWIAGTETNTENERKMLEHLFGVPQNLKDPEDITIPVPNLCVFAANKVCSRLIEKNLETLNKLVDLVAWFGAYEDEFQKAAKWLWEGITEDARYGLRPGGRDVVAIKVKAMRGRGYRHVQLIPGDSFPKVTANLWVVVSELDMRLIVPHELRPDKPLTQVCETDDPKSFNALIDKLQQFIALHSYWKIVTGKVFKVTPKRTSKGEQRQVELKREFLVRPHFRFLPPGHNATLYALGRSLSTLGYTPPQGKTFAKSDVEEGTEIFLRSVDEVNPVFTYTDADLGYKEDDSHGS